MSFVPNGPRYLVRVEEKEEVSEGGIVIAGTVAVKTQRGVVLAAGKRQYLFMPIEAELPFRAGDTIVFFTSTAQRINGESPDLRVVSDENVLGGERA